MIPDTAAALLIVALAFFVLAALCAIFTNLPRSYEAATVDGLRVAVKERWEDYYSPSLNINRINADAVQIAQRDMFISNRGDGLQQIAVIRKAVNSADLPDKRRKQALQELRAAEEETSKPDPDVQKVGDRIEALTRILRDSGALISAGTAVAQALTQLAHWFGGPAGQSVLRLVS